MSASNSGGYTVVTTRLQAARQLHERAAQALMEVARSVNGLDVPTGRRDSTDGCADLLRRLSGTLHTAAKSTRSAGTAVSAAGTLYSGVDRSCLGTLTCE